MLVKIYPKYFYSLQLNSISSDSEYFYLFHLEIEIIYLNNLIKKKNTDQGIDNLNEISLTIRAVAFSCTTIYPSSRNGV